MLKTISTPRTYNFLYNSLAFFSSKTEAPGLGLPKKKRYGDDNVRVTLISNDESISIVSLSEAQKISKGRELKLVKVIDFDNKTQRPVYKLMSGTEYLEEELKNRATKRELRNTTIKGEKLLPISCSIAEHDLMTRIQKLIKWLQKHYEVRVVISGDGKPASVAEGVFKRIESDIKDHGFINQKHSKGTDMKFHVRPNLERTEKLNDSKNDKNSETAPGESNIENYNEDIKKS